MIDHLRRQLAEPLGHPDAVALRDHFERVTRWLCKHDASLPDQLIGKIASRAEMEALLREPPPEAGQDFAHVLEEFTDKIAAYAFRINHPRFLAFVPGAPTPFSVLGDLLCAGTNFFAGVWLEAAGPTQVELIVLDWFKESLGLPAETQGILTSGGSEANLTALVVAREHLPFDERQRAILYVGEHRHGSVDRAAKIIGLRPEQVRPVPGPVRLDPTALANAVRSDRAGGRLPWAVAANGGATNTGAVDPLAELADLCAVENVWFHVDAAYGWSAALIPEGKAALDGIARADSVTLDPHKWFGQTYDCGCLLVRDGRRLEETFAHQPDYMQDVRPAEDEVNFCDRGLALTRRFRALKIWLSVKVLGVSWFRGLVERCCRLAELAQLRLEASPYFEVLCPRQLSIVCFRFAPPGEALDEEALNRLNLALVDDLRATGRAFISSTRLGQRVALRFCFVNWRTTSADVEEAIDLLQALGRKLV